MPKTKRARRKAEGPGPGDTGVGTCSGLRTKSIYFEVCTPVIIVDYRVGRVWAYPNRRRRRYEYLPRGIADELQTVV